MKNIIILSFCFILFSCNKQDGICGFEDLSGNCDELKTSLIDLDNANAEIFFLAYCKDLNANVTSEDPHGHKENTDILINRIVDDCGFEVDLIHYATIETFPTQSEISFTFMESGDTILRIVDLLNDPDGVLAFANIHE